MGLKREDEALTLTCEAQNLEDARGSALLR
jgi:hypothetical protein